MQTMTAQHEWVKHVVTPVSILSDGKGNPVVFVDPELQVIAEDHAAYGCVNCGEAMATHHNRPCEPEDGE